MRRIQHIEVKSEIAAGTRGASLGIDAIKVASINCGSTYFREYNAIEVKTKNHVLFDEHDTPHAKHIEALFEIEQHVADAVADTLGNGDFPLVLAGDHSTAAGTISGIKSAYPDKRVGIVWIDAHADLHTPYTTPSGNMHGMPLAMVTAIDNLDSKINQPSEKEVKFWEKMKSIGGIQPKVDIRDIVFISARDLETPEINLLEQHQIRNFTTDEVREMGAEEIAQQTLHQLNDCDLIYVSFDVDSMDPVLSAGTGTPVPGGLSVDEACKLNRILASNSKVCAWEIVEVNPTLDSVNKMAVNALKVLETTVESVKSRP